MPGAAAGAASSSAGAAAATELSLLSFILFQVEQSF